MRDFSLVLATVGRTVELNRLFDSLLTQTFHDFEVIVVDQNRDDRLQPVLHRARCLGIALRHLQHYPPNLALARNAGIAVASGSWIGFPDDDCWYEPHTLERVMLRSRRRDRPQGVVVRWVEQQDPSPPGLLSWPRSARFRDFPVSSITLFMQRELAARIGGFDGRLGVGQWFGAGEETDIVLRALREGALIAHEPTASVHHRIDPSPHVNNRIASKIARKSARHRARGTGAMYAKHRLPTWVIVRGLLSPLARPLVRGALRELPYGMAVTRGRFDGWLRWRVLHARSDPQAAQPAHEDTQATAHAEVRG